MAKTRGPTLTFKEVDRLKYQEQLKLVYDEKTGKTRKAGVNINMGEDGFILRLHPSGEKSYYITFKAKSGQARTMALGRHPATSPAEAYERARKVRDAVREGRDPVAEMHERIEQQRRDRINGFSEVCDAYIEAVKKKGIRTWRQKQMALNKHAVPYFQDRPVRGIRREDIVELVRKLDAAHGHWVEINGEKKWVSNTSRDIFAKVSAVLAWADRNSMIDVPPCRNIELPGEVITRDRTLSDYELSVVWRATHRLEHPDRGLIQLLMALPLRRCEVSALSRGEVRLAEGVIEIPASRMKGRVSHAIPLTALTLEILQSLPVHEHGPFLFSTTAGVTPFATFGWLKARLDASVATILKEDAERAGRDPATVAPMARFTIHDFRRSARSKLGDLGCSREHAELLLAHRLGDQTERTYNRSLHLEQKRQALEMWQDHLRKIIKPQAVAA